jgi:hypothetical protein
VEFLGSIGGGQVDNSLVAVERLVGVASIVWTAIVVSPTPFAGLLISPVVRLKFTGATTGCMSLLLLKALRL